MRALVVGLLSFALVACATPTPAGALTGTPAPSASASGVPSPSPSFAVDCGSLAADSCAKAVAAAVTVLSVTRPHVVAALVELPTPLMTCAPGGGGPSPLGVKCELIVALTTSARQTLIPLIRTSDSWIPTYLVR